MSNSDNNVKWAGLVNTQVRLWKTKDEKQKKGSDKNVCPWDESFLTISRAFGSRGLLIGKIIGEKVGWEVYDKSIVDYISDSVKLREKIIEAFDEKKKKTSFSQTLFDPKAFSSDKYFRHLTQVILSITELGRAIVIGRGANFIANQNKGFRVRVTASPNFRINFVAERDKMPRKEAKKLVEKMDKERIEYIRHYFHRDPTDPHYYDMVINVEKYSENQVAEMIISALEVNLGMKRPQHPTKESSCDREKEEQEEVVD